MNSSSRIAKQLFEQEQQISALGRTTQTAYSTVGGEKAVPVAATVEEAAVTNEALPIVQEDVAAGNDGVVDLQVAIDAVSEDTDARLEQGRAELEVAQANIAGAMQAVSDAFGQQITDLSQKVDEIVVGAGGVLILYSQQAPTSDDKAPAGSTWWMLNADKNVAGQWQQTGTDDTPEWTPRAIQSDVIANLDVAKLTAGQAALLDVVAMKIAASTASIQTVNVANLFVTQGATMSQAVIDYLFAKVVQAKKITADMIDVNSLNGVTLTGTTIQTAASGRRIVLSPSGSLNFFPTDGSKAVGRLSVSDSGQFQITNPSGSISSYISIDPALIKMYDYPNDYQVSMGSGGFHFVSDVLTKEQVHLTPNLIRILGANGQISMAPRVPMYFDTRPALDASPSTKGYNSARIGLYGVLDNGANDNAIILLENTVTTAGQSGKTATQGHVEVGSKQGTYLDGSSPTGYWDLRAANVRAELVSVKTAIEFPDGTKQTSAATGGDTGWVNLSLRFGYVVHSGRTPQVRRLNGVTYMRGGITTTSGTFTSATYQVAADLPSGFTAPGQNSYFVAFIGTNGATGVISVEGTTVRLTPGGSGVGYMYLNNVIYMEG